MCKINVLCLFFFVTLLTSCGRPEDNNVPTMSGFALSGNQITCEEDTSCQGTECDTDVCTADPSQAAFESSCVAAGFAVKHGRNCCVICTGKP